MFEIQALQYFFEQVCGQACQVFYPIKLPKNATSNFSFATPYIVVAAWAGFKIREWPIENYKKMCLHICTTYNVDILVCGAPSDAQAGAYIADAHPNITNLCGKTSFPDLLYLINNSSLLIANESGPVHIAAALSKPVICFSNGDHFGRFAPYPIGYEDQIRYIYPSQITSQLDDIVAMQKYYDGSLVDIAEIDFAAGKNAVDGYLGELV